MFIQDLREVKIEGYDGLWGAISSLEVDGTQYALMEHNYYGDATTGIVIRVPRFIERKTRKLKSGKIVTFISEENLICETCDSIRIALIDEEILKEEY